MNGLKEALEYIVGLKNPYTITTDIGKFVDKNVVRMDQALRANSLHMTTLSSLVKYIRGNVDTMAEHMLIHVVSPTEVRLLSMLDKDRRREVLVDVEADLPHIEFNSYMGSESFLISIKSKFMQNKDAETLLQFAGTVESGTVATYGDDGISQAATIKHGIAGKNTVLVPNPVRLAPYRTFVEVAQPESEFVFRMRDEGNGVKCALFEADGGAWKLQAMRYVSEYLKEQLEGLEQFTIIN